MFFKKALFHSVDVPCYLTSSLVCVCHCLPSFAVMNTPWGITFIRHSHIRRSCRLIPRGGNTDSGHTTLYWFVNEGRKNEAHEWTNDHMSWASHQALCSAQSPYGFGHHHFFCFSARLGTPRSIALSFSTLAFERPWRTMTTTALCLATWTSFQWMTVTPTGVSHSHGTSLWQWISLDLGKSCSPESTENMFLSDMTTRRCSSSPGVRLFALEKIAFSWEMDAF